MNWRFVSIFQGVDQNLLAKLQRPTCSFYCTALMSEMVISSRSKRNFMFTQTNCATNAFIRNISQCPWNKFKLRWTEAFANFYSGFLAGFRENNHNNMRTWKRKYIHRNIVVVCMCVFLSNAFGANSRPRCLDCEKTTGKVARRRRNGYIILRNSLFLGVWRGSKTNRTQMSRYERQLTKALLWIAADVTYPM